MNAAPGHDVEVPCAGQSPAAVGRTLAMSAGQEEWPLVGQTDADYIVSVDVTDLAPGQSRTVCSEIVFLQNGIDRPETGNARACANITREPPTTQEYEAFDCEWRLFGRESGIHRRSTQAAANVAAAAADAWKEAPGGPCNINTCPNNASGTTTGSTHVRTVNRNANTWRSEGDVLWTRPGDSIQFKHEYRSGAQCVRRTTYVDHSRDGGADNFNQSRDNTPFVRNSCRITATTPSSAYLFEAPNPAGVSRTDDGWNCAGANGTLVNRDMRSPSPTNTQYSCPPSATSPQFPNVTPQAGGYQIPGFDVRPATGCGALAPGNDGSHTGSNVGQTITQQMEFWGGQATSVTGGGRDNPIPPGGTAPAAGTNWVGAYCENNATGVITSAQ